jgi:hypothetical protein
MQGSQGGASPSSQLPRRWSGYNVLSYSKYSVTVLEDTMILGIKGGSIERVLEELCYREAETLRDAEEPATQWRYNSVR